ncbi:elongation factor G [Candidatus Vidania fulgoroideorum]
MFKKIRNIGICAHIDAGKTTVTERILYYTGKKHKIGEVHDGEATMDWMDQEKERGITINAASTSVYWNGTDKKLGKHKINIIDTPGHVDFTAEVERSMRVLDGACVVFCSVAGVQAQSETVWNQINKYNIPRVAFINKMDRVGSDYFKVCSEIEKIFNIDVLKLHLPIYKKNIFLGFIDLITMKSIIFDESSKGVIINVSDIKSDYIYKAQRMRKEMIEKLVAPYDDYLEKYFNNKIKVNDIKYLINKRTINLSAVPAICGSAFKNKGIQNLLDSIIMYLPSPVEKKNYYLTSSNKKKLININSKNFSSFCFKTVNDNFAGKLSYIRVYSGKLIVGESLINSNSNKKYKISRIIQIHANYKLDIKKISNGDIAAIVGVKEINTGDTLYSNKYINFEKITFPDPVISFTIEAKDNNHEKLLISVKKLSSEDPTIKLSNDPENGKILISGMGELHIDVFIERLRREFKIDVIKSNPKVSYRETITKKSIGVEGKYIRQSGGRGQYGHVVLNVYPRKIGSGYKFVNIIKSGAIPAEYIKPIKKSLFENLKKGVVCGYPVVDIKIELSFGSYHEVDSNENAFKIATSIALKNALKKSLSILLEPIMKIEILSPNKYMGIIIGDLSSKGGSISSNKLNGESCEIKAIVPMREMFGYSTKLRSFTKGRASYTMEFYCYKKIHTK